MSKEELSAAYAEGRISRRRFVQGLAAVGGTLGAVMAGVGAAAALQDPDYTAAKKAPAKKAPPAKKAVAAKKPTTTTSTTTPL